MNKKTLFLLVAVASLAFSAAAQAKKSVLTDRSFAGVRVGMKVREASRALGVPLVSEGDAEGGCRYYKAKSGFKDVGFMVTDGTIARFDIFERGFATLSGARVGDSEASVKRLYRGRYRIEPHKYVDGHYIYVGDKKFAVVFETDGKKVTSIRAGRLPEAGWIEGCS